MPIIKLKIEKQGKEFVHHNTEKSIYKNFRDFFFHFLGNINKKSGKIQMNTQD